MSSVCSQPTNLVAHPYRAPRPRPSRLSRTPVYQAVPMRGTFCCSRALSFCDASGTAHSVCTLADVRISPAGSQQGDTVGRRQTHADPFCNPHWLALNCAQLASGWKTAVARSRGETKGNKKRTNTASTAACTYDCGLSEQKRI